METTEVVIDDIIQKMTPHLNIEDISMSKQELIVLGKGNKERKTYLSDNAKFYLKRYLQSRIDEPDLLNHPLFVILDKPHNHLAVSGIQYMLRQLGKKAGFPIGRQAMTLTARILWDALFRPSQ